MEKNPIENSDLSYVESNGLTLEPQKLPSAVLERLIEEVRNEDTSQQSSSYNRFHNRHNRSR